MFEPEPAADAPKEVVYLILGSLQFSEAQLRLYGLSWSRLVGQLAADLRCIPVADHAAKT